MLKSYCSTTNELYVSNEEDEGMNLKCESSIYSIYTVRTMEKKSRWPKVAPLTVCIDFDLGSNMFDRFISIALRKQSQTRPWK